MNTNQIGTLLACPCCGRGVDIKGGGLSQEAFSIMCISCGLTMVNSDKAWLIQRWNNRAAQPTPLLKDLKEAIETAQSISDYPNQYYAGEIGLSVSEVEILRDAAKQSKRVQELEHCLHHLLKQLVSLTAAKEQGIDPHSPANHSPD